jgi:hypothetical protein
MSSPQVLRILRKDAPDEHLLVHITSAGRTPKPLDLKLIGTDNQALYATSIRDSSTKALQSAQFLGSIDEWKATLAFVLLHHRPEGTLPEYLKGVEIVAEIAASKFTITIRKIVGGITQSLGRVELLQASDDEATDFFDWASAAAASSDQLREQLQFQTTASTEQQDEIERLKAELERLVEAKKQHEQELLTKFAALLNEKKLKIRDQQRLLSHAKVDPDAAEDVKTSRAKSHVGTSSRAKRKVVDEDEDVEDGEQTPPPSGEETEEETEDEHEHEHEHEHEQEGISSFAPPRSASQASSRTSAAPHVQQSEAHMDVDNDAPLPPRRELPFSMPSKQKSGPAPPSSADQKTLQDEDEGESTDDEL